MVAAAAAAAAGGVRSEGAADAAEGARIGCAGRIGAHAMTLPGAPHLARSGVELRLDSHPLAALAREHGTPLYVYSRAAMQESAAAYQPRAARPAASGLLRDVAAKLRARDALPE